MALDVHLVTPEEEVWTGPASFVVARGVDGDLGVLPGHAPLLARLAIGPVVIQGDDSRTVAVVDGGFLHVGRDSEDDDTRVDILAEHAVLRQDVRGEDIGRIEQLAAELREEGRFDEARAEQAKARFRQQVEGG